MKKHVLAAALTAICAVLSLSSCMTGGQSLGLGTSTPGTTTAGSVGSAAGDIIGGLLGTLIGNAVPVTEQSIAGTWIYASPEVRFESENFLAQAGGQVAANTIANKLSDIYSSIGIKPGTSGFVFNADKTCTIALGAQAINGTYSVDPKTNSIHIVSSTGLIKLNGKVYFGLNSLALLFDSNKILSIVQTLSAFTGKSNSTMGALSSALSNYDGMLLGMSLQKK